MKKCFYLLSLVFIACTSSTDNKQNTISQKQIKEPLIKANKTASEIENEQIEAYIKRRGWEVEETGTGLRYLITFKGGGKLPEVGDVAQIKYKISLINGKECYQSQEDTPEEFVVEKDNIESGLQEGIQYIPVGSKATFIIPSHLAHGLLGDLNKIPPRSTIIYEVHLVGIK